MESIKSYECECGEEIYEDDVICCNCGNQIDRSRLVDEPLTEITHQGPFELVGALRQFRHNNSDGFVIGYDRKIVDVRIASLEGMLKFLVENDSINDSSIEKEVVALLSNDK